MENDKVDVSVLEDEDRFRLLGVGVGDLERTNVGVVDRVEHGDIEAEAEALFCSSLSLFSLWLLLRDLPSFSLSVSVSFSLALCLLPVCKIVNSNK